MAHGDEKYTKNSDNYNYQADSIVLNSSDKELLQYCEEYTQKAKLFKNSVVFVLRQLYFARQKDFQDLHTLEHEVLENFKLTEDKFKPIGKKYFLPSYPHLDYYFRKTKNPDYFCGLPMQTVQQIEKEALNDFKGFWSSMKKFSKDKSGFTGMPKIPDYIKADKISFAITNQDGVIYDHILKLPKTKGKLLLGKLTGYKFQEDDVVKTEGDFRLKDRELAEVIVSPFYDTYKITLVTRKLKEEPIASSPARILSLDLGVNNFVTSSNNVGLAPFIINGKKLKSMNQYFNKKVGHQKSELMKINGFYTSNKIRSTLRKRNNSVSDFMNKSAHFILEYCKKHNIDTVVIGKNDGWKNGADLFHKNDQQNFMFIPFNLFINKMNEMSIKHNVQIIVREESYTSLTSFLDNDFIPTYGQEPKEFSFSGERIKRGMYQSKNGLLINADVNGASNILRKAFPNAFDDITDFSYLTKTVIRHNIV